MGMLDSAPRFLFFTGTGGVGKTALSCATALRLADAGKKLLLVSTDPASNLDQMLGTPVTNQPTAIPGAPGLFAMNIDPEQAADAYRERVIAPYRSICDASQISQLQEQLAGACTTEIAAFDEFAGLLAGDVDPGWDHIIFDTAPTGHTLRLLSLPRAWTRFLEDSPHSESCLGPHAGLKMQHDRFSAAFAALTDATRTTVVVVTPSHSPRPRRSARRPSSKPTSAARTSSRTRGSSTAASLPRARTTRCFVSASFVSWSRSRSSGRSTPCAWRSCRGRPRSPSESSGCAGSREPMRPDGSVRRAREPTSRERTVVLGVRRTRPRSTAATR